MPATTAPHLTHEERRAKITKIRALLNKTKANGCTAGEADSALVLAERLMAKYGINEDEVQPEPERVRTDFGSWFDDIFREQARRARQQDQQPRPKANGHRKNHSHAGCDHEATSSARAKCRRSGGPH